VQKMTSLTKRAPNGTATFKTKQIINKAAFNNFKYAGT